MPKPFDIPKDKIIQNLNFVKNNQTSISLEYIPSHESIKQYTPKYERIQKENLTFQLIQIDIKDMFIRMYPRYLNPESVNFLSTRHSSIESITLQGKHFLNTMRCDETGNYYLPENVDDTLKIIKKFPKGFIRDCEYGLGLFKECKYIVRQIEEEFQNIRHLVISCDEETHTNEETYTLNYLKFLEIRTGLERISRKYREKGAVQKNIFAYNEIVGDLCHDYHYEAEYEPYVKDTIYNSLQQLDSFPSLSKKDYKAIFDIVSYDLKRHYDNDKENILKLQQEIELVNLQSLISKMKDLLDKESSKEEEWQKILSENPFVLSLTFGYPVVKIQEQASVGGRKIDGKGDKITDFLVKKHLTHNVALVEIKTPSTKLLQVKEYRGGVHAASSDLSGSINQILDQKYKFQTEIKNLKLESKIYDMESYSIDCVLIIGRIPEEDVQKKCFELFRHNSKDVKIITFDELLGRMQEIHSFLSPNFDDVPF